jgi:hypothetical protein
MTDLNRSLTVLADGEPVKGFRRAWLTGRDALGLLPLPFVLRVWNLSDDGYYALFAAKQVSVLRKDSVLASGKVSSVYRRTVPEGTVTEIAFSPGLSLWEAQVSLSVEAGVTVSETVNRILESSGTGIPLLSFPGNDQVFSRPQAFFGRAAECVNEALSAAKARGYLTEAGLGIVPEGGLPDSLVLTASDLLDEPVRVGNLAILRTRPVGWPLGKMVSVTWKGESFEGLVMERSVDADTMEGKWEAEMLIKLNY